MFIGIAGLYFWPAHPGSQNHLKARLDHSTPLSAEDQTWYTKADNVGTPRIRGVGNGFSWTIGMICGYVLWPFVSVYLRETTGSFQAPFLLIPIMVIQTLIIWFYSPENAGKELDEIAV
jgi:hypothetical protein